MNPFLLPGRKERTVELSTVLFDIKFCSDEEAQKNLLKGRFFWRSGASVSIFPLLGAYQLLTWVFLRLTHYLISA